MGQPTVMLALACCVTVLPTAYSKDETPADSDTVPVAFAHGGKFKMLYDCRQRPQSVLLHQVAFTFEPLRDVAVDDDDTT